MKNNKLYFGVLVCGMTFSFQTVFSQAEIITPKEQRIENVKKPIKVVKVTELESSLTISPAKRVRVEKTAIHEKRIPKKRINDQIKK